MLEAEGPVHDVLGYSADDLTSGRAPFFDRVHPGDTDLLTQLDRVEALPEEICLRFRHADGQIRCLAVRPSSAPGQELLLSIQTAQHGLQQGGALAPEAQLSAFLENTEEGIFLKDLNHVYVAASAPFRARLMLRLNGRDLIGLTDYDFLPENEADQFFESEKTTLLKGGNSEVLAGVTLPNGTHWIYSRHFPLRSDDRVTGVFGISSNVTERLRAEETVNPADASEAARRAVQTGTYVMDIARGAFATSASLDDILGITPDYPHTMAGWKSLIHPEDRRKLLEYLESVFAVPGRIFNREYRVIRQNDGAQRWVQGIGRLVRDGSGNPLLMRGTLQDITPRKLTEAALRETRDRLQLFIEHAPAALAMFDREMRYLAVSRRWLESRKMDRDILGKRHYDVAPDIPEHWKEAHQRGLAGEAVRGSGECYEHPDGTVQWFRWEILPWRTDEGEVGGIVIFLEDFTEEKTSQDRLKLAASVFAHATEAIMVMDLSSRILEVNESFIRITGFQREEVLGQTPRFLRSPRQDQDSYQKIWDTLRATGRWRGEVWGQAQDGRQFATVATLTTVYEGEDQPRYYVALLADITPVKEREQKLEHLSRHDALTGLPNRIVLTERLRLAMAQARDSQTQLAVMYLDLDNFKAVNDQFGREASDQLLLALANRIAENLKPGSTLGRLGGDELLIILPGLTCEASATEAMQRLLHIATQPFPIGDVTLEVSATAGVALYPQPQDVDADQLVRQADQAMYEAKLAGKARIQIFDPVRASSVRGRHEELRRIREGVKAGEFLLHYQPKVNMATGELIGAEALIRWNHPNRGMLYPHSFLPVTEDNDVAVELGQWVLDTALTQLEVWQSRGFHVPISVNVSARHLQQPDFMERLEAQLRAHPYASPRLLELELVETSTLHDMLHVSKIIELCTRMGISIAIDDFGTGYSSLTYLKRLPAHVLKIDQSFVRDMLEDPDDLAILQGVIGLATAFRRLPVAEGIESIEHGVMLLKLGCQCAQGFGIARSMPAEELIEWARHWKPDPRWAQVRPVSQSDWPMLIAEVELRVWNRVLQSYVAGARTEAPELDPHLCRFGVWLDSERTAARRPTDVLHALEQLHNEQHQLAREAVRQMAAGRSAQAAQEARHAAERVERIRVHLARMSAPEANPLTRAGAYQRNERWPKLQ